MCDACFPSRLKTFHIMWQLKKLKLRVPVPCPRSHSSRVDHADLAWNCVLPRQQGDDDRGWDGWMASLAQWTWVWARSGRWWRTGKPSMLQSMGPQSVGRDWATEKEALPWITCMSQANFLKLWVLVSQSRKHKNCLNTVNKYRENI